MLQILGCLGESSVPRRMGFALMSLHSVSVEMAIYIQPLTRRKLDLLT